jgi:hypothetical protein
MQSEHFLRPVQVIVAAALILDASIIVSGGGSGQSPLGRRRRQARAAWLHPELPCLGGGRHHALQAVPPGWQPLNARNSPEFFRYFPQCPRVGANACTPNKLTRLGR